MFNFPDLDAIAIHRVSVLEPPNVSAGESTCLRDRIANLAIGYPGRCIFAKKNRVATGPAGWKCHYGGTFRPFILPTVLPNQKPSKSTANGVEHATHSQRNDAINVLVGEDDLS